jgi:hypothetical protein
MSFKSWVHEHVQRLPRMVSFAGRPDLPAAGDETPARADPEPGLGAEPEPHLDGVLGPTAAHLGGYAPLIGAIREELEHFMASHVRLHLAIADRDRFLLTGVGVACAPGDEAARRALQRFLREFKPEQVKRYLAREVIGGLPNAAAIDLTQFAGLFDGAPDDEGDDEAGAYRELLAALRRAPESAAPPFEVSVHGRWSELDAPRTAPSVHAALGSAPATPLAGQRQAFDIEDGAGRRCVVLPAVVAGRRYAVGKGEACDLRVDGTYTSRRHAEVWLEGGAWWVADAGSTNGIRVEPGGAHEGGTAEAPLRLAGGARVVLSARAEGPAADHPWLALREPARTGSRLTPIAPAPRTPLTAVVPSLAYTITAGQGGGVRTLAIHAGALPLSVGRSRNQALVVERRHEGVSGHHLDLVALDDSGVHVVVHGDNGVVADGVARAAGERFLWRPGETLVLGALPGERPACTLTLARAEPRGSAP